MVTRETKGVISGRRQVTKGIPPTLYYAFGIPPHESLVLVANVDGYFVRTIALWKLRRFVGS